MSPVTRSVQLIDQTIQQVRLPIVNNHWLGMHGALQIKTHRLGVSRLEPSLSNLTIAHLSDLHVDFNTLPWLEAAIDHLNHLKPDLVLLTGDFITKGSRWLPQLTRLLQRIECGTKVACLGNHDYMDGHKSRRIRPAIEQGGVTLLINERLLYHRQWGALQLAGVDDFHKGKPRPKHLQRQLDPDIPTLLLCHNPAQLEAEPDWPGVILTLSGHTHGGQFGLPDWIMRPVVGTRYIRTCDQVGDGWLSVSNGIGTASLTFGKKWYRLNLPMPRFNTPAEIALWHLQPMA